MRACLVAGKNLYTEDGIGRYVKGLSKSLGDSKSIDSLVIGRSYLRTQKFSQKISNTIRKFSQSAAMEYDYLIDFIYNRHTLKKELRNIKSDIFHFTSPDLFQNNFRDNSTTITTIHDVIPLIFPGRFMMEKHYFNLNIKNTLKSDIIFADSNNTKNDIVKYFNAKQNNIYVMYPGIDLELFKNNKKTIPHDSIFTIMYLGGLVKRKGIFELIDAFKLLLKIRQDIKLEIVGYGEEETAVRNYVDNCKIKQFVTIHGFVDSKKLMKIFSSIDLFVYPSKYEGFGYTPLEAMAAGIPVISSRSSSIPEVVGKASILINPNNIHDIAKKIDYVLNNPNLRRSMIERGFKQAKMFDIKNTSRTIIEFYKDAIKDRNKLTI